MNQRVQQRQANTGHEDWGTPAYIIEAARLAMGEIELDPASSPKANEVVRASRFFTKEENGLAQSWESPALWLNPPFSAGAMKAFVGKLYLEWSAGRIAKACVVTNNSTETQWGQRLSEMASAICLLEGRVKFHLLVDGEYQENTLGNLTGQVVWFLNRDDPDPALFRQAFTQLGQSFWH